MKESVCILLWSLRKTRRPSVGGRAGGSRSLVEFCVLDVSLSRSIEIDFGYLGRELQTPRRPW
jgi:hypothetical protein